MALYWPDGGYYSRWGPIGGSGDYYTSPLAHPAFGALLAVQLFQMWKLLEQPAAFHVIEPGAGTGRLCRDVLSFAAQLPDGFGDSLRYVCVDRGVTRGERRRKMGPTESLPRACRSGRLKDACFPTSCWTLSQSTK